MSTTTKNRNPLRRLSTESTAATANTSISSGFMSLSSSLASMSASFANALALELDVDLRHNEEDNKRSSDNSSTGMNNCSANNNISAIYISQDTKNNKCPPPKFRPSQFNKFDKHQHQHQQQQQQLTDERANLVQNDARLKALLAAEVQKSGVVTTVGYNAVFQKFLMSDEVEKEMANDKDATNIHAPRRTRRKASARRQQQQDGLMGRLVSSFSSVPTSRNGDMTSAVNLNRRRSVDCDPDSSQLLLKSPNIDDDVGGLPSSFDEDGRSRDNIAPRKMKSFKGENQQEIVKQVSTTNGLQSIDMSALQALQESELLDEDVEDNGDSNSPIVVPSRNNIRRRIVNPNRRGSVESLNLEDVFDGNDGTKRIVPPPVILSASSSPAEIVDALGSNNFSYNDDDVILEHANHDDDTANIRSKDGEGEDLVSLSSK